MNITTSVDGRGLVVVMRGRLDTLTTPDVQKKIEPLLDSCEKCVLDMADVDYISSAGLRLLLLLHKRMEAKGGELVARQLQPGVRDILEMTGFTSFLTLA